MNEDAYTHKPGVLFFFNKKKTIVNRWGFQELMSVDQRPTSSYTVSTLSCKGTAFLSNKILWLGLFTILLRLVIWRAHKRFESGNLEVH